MVMVHRRTLLAGALGSGLFALGCNRARSSLSDLNICLPWSHSSEFAFLYKGVADGAFGDLNVAFTETRGSAQVAQALELGTSQFGLIGADVLILARLRGVPIKALGVLYQNTPAVLMSLTGIADPLDLIGKRVCVIETSTVASQYRSLLKSWGIDADSVTTIAANRGGEAQIAAGECDALTQFTNFAPITLRRAGRNVTEIPFRNYVTLYGTCLATTDEVLESHPEVCEQVVRGFVEGIRTTVEQPDAALQLVPGSETQIDAEEARLRLVRTIELIREDVANDAYGQMSRDRWAASQETVIASAQEEGLRAIDPAYFFDDRFVRARAG